MIPIKKNNLKEKYLRRYRPFFWSFGSLGANLSNNDPDVRQYIANKTN
ncbi:MAG: hypothetical protein KDD31_04760 [Muricauda sp.]|nr:hypothetical protein [Allomuricauda sp.]